VRYQQAQGYDRLRHRRDRLRCLTDATESPGQNYRVVCSAVVRQRLTKPASFVHRLVLRSTRFTDCGGTTRSSTASRSEGRSRSAH